MATHGSWCGTRVWRTLCMSCNTKVWFFSCQCGSRVFFDQLGYPWPEHDCETSWLRDIRRVVESDGSIRVDIREEVSVVRPSSISGIAGQQPRQRLRLIPMEPVESQYPTREVLEVSGTLHEIAQGPTLQKELGLPDTSMVHAFLDSLGPEWGRALGKLTIHSPTSSSRIWEKYVALIPADIVGMYQNKSNHQVFVILSAVGPFSKKAWLCSHLSILG